MNFPQTDTICALATPAGSGAIAVIRISGKNAFNVTSKIFRSAQGKQKDFSKLKTHSLHYGSLLNGDKLVDEVIVSVFRSPHSYTSEDTVEISCHGSIYIQQQVLQLLQKEGIRLAQPGEFTLRAFLNGKLDLSQAEAVADLIASQDSTAHRLALQQLRGGFSTKIKELRTELINFASLVELELDFAEEDVEFANRKQLLALVENLCSVLTKLQQSFEAGNVLKNGIPVVIAGKPNAGKSTLLNALLNEEKAIVSEIPGTTRDVIEDEMVIDGYRFRFLDTAGIRHTTDVVEKIGVERTHEQLAKAGIVIYIVDAVTLHENELTTDLISLKTQLRTEQHLIVVFNKTDIAHSTTQQLSNSTIPFLSLSAKQKTGIDELKQMLVNYVKRFDNLQTGEPMVVNARHADALQKANEELNNVISGINQHVSTDLLAFHIRQSLHHLSEITGDIYTDDLLENIFSKFCIGK